MGDYLSTPIRDKEIVDGENHRVGASKSVDDVWNMRDAGVEEEHGRRVFVRPQCWERYFALRNIRRPRRYPPCLIIGQEIALFAKAHFIEELTQSSEFKSGDYAGALRASFLRIDELLQTPEGHKELTEISSKHCKGAALYGTQEGDEIAFNEGCTACIVLITRTEIYVANAGDSRCVLSLNGEPIVLSAEHVPDLPEERKRIEAAGGSVEEGRVKGVLKFSRALGDLEYKRNKDLSAEEQMIVAVPETRVEQIRPESEFLVVACRGVWECYRTEKLMKELRGEVWDAEAKKPVKKKLSKLISGMLDAVLASDTTEEGELCY